VGPVLPSVLPMRVAERPRDGPLPPADVPEAEPGRRMGDLTTMEWREWLQDELKGVLRTWLQQKRPGTPSLPPIVTVQAEEVPHPPRGRAPTPYRRKPRSRGRPGSTNNPSTGAHEPSQRRPEP